MNGPKRVPLIIIVLIALAAVLLVWNVSDADDDDEHGHGQAHHGDNGEVSVTAGSTVVNKHSGISVAGSDMEIDDGLATWSFGFGLVQGTNVNPVTSAETLNRQGKYYAAAKMLCSTKKYKKVYGKGPECIAAIILEAPPESVPLPVVEDDGRYAELVERFERLESERAQEDESRQQANVRYARQQQVQQQQYEQIQEIENARQKRIELIKSEFGKDE